MMKSSSLLVCIKFHQNDEPKGSVASMWLLWSHLELHPLLYLTRVTYVLTSFEPLLLGPVLTVPLTSCRLHLARGRPAVMGVKNFTPVLHSDGHYASLVCWPARERQLIDEITVQE